MDATIDIQLNNLYSRLGTIAYVLDDSSIRLSWLVSRVFNEGAREFPIRANLPRTQNILRLNFTWNYHFQFVRERTCSPKSLIYVRGVCWCANCVDIPIDLHFGKATRNGW